MAGNGQSGKRLGSSASGTRRLFLAFGTGIAGLFYLIIVVVPVVSGGLEFGATEANLATIEREGFPDAEYLSIDGGKVIFSHARTWISGRKEKRHLFQMTAPVVSDEQQRAWDAAGASGEPLDLAKLRLVVVFTGEQVKELWPEVHRLAMAEEPLTVAPGKMAVTGDTVIAKGQLSLPTFNSVKTRNRTGPESAD